MSRVHTVHRCIACGQGHPRWSGRCASCGEWNSLVPEAETRPGAVGPAVPMAVGEVDLTGGESLPTGLEEFDRALGGGLVAGSVTLIGGEPGIGKSTLLLQVAGQVARSGRRALVCCAEESVEQVARRAARLSISAPSLRLVACTSLEALLELAAAERPDLLVVDSVQTVASTSSSGVAGSVTQVRECATVLAGFAKSANVAIILSGHVTKDGALAGPRLLEHVVDTVVGFEGDRHHSLRILSVTKHRFGPTGELGLFEMGPGGLATVADPSAFLLADRRREVPGSVVLALIEGRRPLLVEVQALVTAAAFATARRTAQGVAPGRLALLLAVLDQRAGLSARGLDVFCSLVGGVRANEPGVDLALGLALASAITGVPVPSDTVVFGEVGLGGEVRQVAHAPARIAEAARSGFRRAVVPPASPEAPAGPTRIEAVGSLVEAVAALGLLEAPESGAAGRGRMAG